MLRDPVSPMTRLASGREGKLPPAKSASIFTPAPSAIGGDRIRRVRYERRLEQYRSRQLEQAPEIG